MNSKDTTSPENKQIENAKVLHSKSPSRPHETGLETTQPYNVRVPEQQTAPVVFSSPHSGRYYPPHFLNASRLDKNGLRASEDYFVDDVFAGVVDLGAPLLAANFPRAYVDMNREPYELDPRMFSHKLPPHANTRSVRVAGGLGTVARVVSENREIYKHPMAVEEAFDRIEHVYRPWHDKLRNLLAKTHVKFGHSVLVDCHSMPSGTKNASRLRKQRDTRADFILGDRYGTSCSAELTDAAQDYLKSLGYNVARNTPYAGGFITEHYGRPAKGLHAMQIEINRSLYVDEQELNRTVGYHRLQKDMMQLAQVIIDASIHLDKPPMQLAAE